MSSKIKHVLKEKGSELPRQKSNHPTCFFCHPQIVPTKVSRENKICHGEQQSNAIKPDALGLGTLTI